MTIQDYKKHKREWFKGQEAVANREIVNYRGDAIAQGDTVVINMKHIRGGFSITSKSTGVHITRVGHEKIDMDFPESRGKRLKLTKSEAEYIRCRLPYIHPLRRPLYIDKNGNLYRVSLTKAHMKASESLVKRGFLIQGTRPYHNDIASQLGIEAIEHKLKSENHG